jgi:hypothetical protein
VVVGARVLAVAALTWAVDLSYGSSLLRLEAGQAPVVLLGQVAGASRPVVSSSGRLFVARGRAGPEVPRGLRVDALRIDEVNLETGASTTVYEAVGSFTSSPVHLS